MAQQSNCNGGNNVSPPQNTTGNDTKLMDMLFAVVELIIISVSYLGIMLILEDSPYVLFLYFAPNMLETIEDMRDSGLFDKQKIFCLSCVIADLIGILISFALVTVTAGFVHTVLVIISYVSMLVPVVKSTAFLVINFRKVL